MEHKSLADFSATYMAIGFAISLWSQFWEPLSLENLLPMFSDLLV